MGKSRWFPFKFYIKIIIRTMFAVLYLVNLITSMAVTIENDTLINFIDRINQTKMTIPAPSLSLGINFISKPIIKISLESNWTDEK